MFLTIMILTTGLIASMAAYISVFGLVHIYSYYPITIGIAAASLEMGKIAATSFVYRYWNNCSRLLRSYLISSIIILMLITSLGIYGFLAGGFQQSSISNSATQIELTYSQDSKSKTDTSISSLEKQIADLPSNYSKSRIKLYNAYSEELSGLREKSNKLTDKIVELETKLLKSSAELGPIVYIAKALDLTLEKAVTYVTLLLILVFDPLAIVLTIACNFILMRKIKPEPTPIKKIKPETTPIKKKIVEPASEGNLFEIEKPIVGDPSSFRNAVTWPEVEKELRLSEPFKRKRLWTGHTF